MKRWLEVVSRFECKWLVAVFFILLILWPAFTIDTDYRPGDLFGYYFPVWLGLIVYLWLVRR